MSILDLQERLRYIDRPIILFFVIFCRLLAFVDGFIIKLEFRLVVFAFITAKDTNRIHTTRVTAREKPCVSMCKQLQPNRERRRSSWGAFPYPDDNSPVEHHVNESSGNLSSRVSSVKSTPTKMCRAPKSPELISSICPSKEIIYEPDKNGLIGGTPSVKRRLSRSSVYPSGTNLITHDAFGEDLTLRKVRTHF